jgi:hypothetical protein
VHGLVAGEGVHRDGLPDEEGVAGEGWSVYVVVLFRPRCVFFPLNFLLICRCCLICFSEYKYSTRIGCMCLD